MATERGSWLSAPLAGRVECELLIQLALSSARRQQCTKAQFEIAEGHEPLGEPHDAGNRRSHAFPLLRLYREPTAARGREPVVFGPAAELRDAPIRLDQALMHHPYSDQDWRVSLVPDHLAGVTVTLDALCRVSCCRSCKTA